MRTNQGGFRRKQPKKPEKMLTPADLDREQRQRLVRQSLPTQAQIDQERARIAAEQAYLDSLERSANQQDQPRRGGGWLSRLLGEES